MPWKNLLILIALFAVCFLFFSHCLDNGFWHISDFRALENSIRLSEDPLALFESDPPFKFQPLVYGVHHLLFNTFLFEPKGYFAFNIILHALNSWLVYLLVNALLRDRSVALLSGLLFAFTIGSYGKSVMIASGLEDLMITFLTLLTMIFYFKNELDGNGRIASLRYFLTLLFFLASMFTKSTSFAILGCFLAFNYFFRAETGKPVLRPNFLILAAIAVAALIVKFTVFHYSPPLYSKYPGIANFIFLAGKNTINYLVRMIFPIHTSNLVTEAGTAVRFVYRFATAIRILLALTILSYSFFGFIFGNRTIRFFIAWTYIMVLPFAFFQFPYDWLNIRHLYLVSVGFVSVISAGAVYCSRLISANRWGRLVPFAVPLAFILLSRFIVTQLDRSYEIKARSETSARYMSDLDQRYGELLRLRGAKLPRR